MDHAALGRGGGMVLCWARRLRFWTVAVIRRLKSLEVCLGGFGAHHRITSMRAIAALAVFVLATCGGSILKTNRVDEIYTWCLALWSRRV